MANLRHAERLLLHRLDDQAGADRRRGRPDFLDFAVNDAGHVLQVRLELAAADAGDLLADAAQVFGLAAVGLLVAVGPGAAGEFAGLRHDSLWKVRLEV